QQGGTGQAAGTTATAPAAQTQAAAQAQAQAEAQAAAQAQQQAQAQAAAQAQAQAQQEARAAAEAEQQRAAAATSTRTSSNGAVAIPSSSVAPRTAHDYWTKHIAQFSGKYLPDGPTMRPNCGPASVTMALRMIGLDVPGFNGQNSEAVLDKA